MPVIYVDHIHGNNTIEPQSLISPSLTLHEVTFLFLGFAIAFFLFRLYHSAKSGIGSHTPWRGSWLQDSGFVLWLAKDSGDSHRFFCRVCNRSYKFRDKSCISAHGLSAIHMNLMDMEGDDYPVFKTSVEYQSDHLEHDVLDYEVRFTEDAEVLCKAGNGQIPYDTAIYRRSAQGDDNEGSGKREEELRPFIVELNLEVEKVMSYSGTRWLESYKCYDLLYTYWQALLGYFTLEAFEHFGDSERVRMRDLLNDKRLQALTGFLVYNLDLFNTFNAKYQSKKLLAHKLWRDTETFVHDIGSNYINPVALPEITSDVFCIAESRRELSQIIVGEKCDRVMEGMSADDNKWVLEYAEQFYVTAVTEMRERLFIHRNLFERLISMEPRVALGEDRSFDSNIRYVCENHLTFLDAEATRLEWERLPQSLTREQIIEYSDLDTEDFWKIIMNLKGNDVVQYPKLIDFSAAISCIPHSNAEPERSFSDVNKVIDPLGNQTGIKLLNAECFLRSYVHAYPQENAIHFVPNAKHFASFNKDMCSRFHSDD
ncbi:hypothetical protein QAD02_000415 [Eretmocerus hayati]|uniref:Uncharacterized protein n=1 Tax=Eretmocerus hayati TaxID=131215 RepID=A0ACC2NDJ4_9HYME|nr:hypothetical protein QAD02_000415 [Eretmocerus hayati]